MKSSVWIAFVVASWVCMMVTGAEELSGLMLGAKVLGLIPGERAQPSDGIKLIGAGQAKTGTQSIKAALEMIGYKVYHMDEVQTHGHTEMVTKAFRATDAEREKYLDLWFDEMLKLGFNATLDWPSSLVFDYQLKRFPEAKVLYSHRSSAEEWIKSFQSQSDRLAPVMGLPFVWLVDLREFGAAMYDLAGFPFKYEHYTPPYLPWVDVVLSQNIDFEGGKTFYERHEKKVKELVPKDQLLVYHVRDGWDRLCKFLDTPVPPNVPFPNRNSSQDQKILAIVLRIIAFTYPFLAFFPLATVIGLVYFCCFSSATSKKEKYA